MIPSALLLLAVSAMAAPDGADPAGPVVRIEKIAEIPVPSQCGLARNNCAHSQTLSHFMTGGDWVGLWDLRTGQQVARVEWQGGRKPPEGRKWVINPIAVSPDGKWLVASHEDWRLDAGEVDSPLDVVNSVVLVDVARQEVVKTLLTVKGLCLHARAQCTRVFSGTFSEDSRRIGLWTLRFTKDGWTPEGVMTWEQHWTHEYAVYDLDGRLKSRRYLVEFETAKGAVVNKDGHSFAGGFLKDGRAVVIKEYREGCELLDAASGKHISFLALCTDKVSPYVAASGIYAFGDREVKAWDPLTGKALRPAQPLPDSEDGIGLTVDEKILSVMTAPAKEPAKRSVKFFEFATGRSLGQGELPAGSYGFRITADPKVAVYFTRAAGHENTISIAKLGFPDGAAPASEPTPRIDVDRFPAAAVAADPDAYAVVIGVERYRQSGIPAVDYADGDARTVRAYLTGAMGFDPRNVVLLTGERASKTDLEKHLGTWLKNRVGPKSRVFVYYAGHGAPNPTSGAGYLMPYEADPSYLEDTAFPLAKLYASLDALPTRDVTVVLDACFSGQGPRSLIAKGARPLIAVSAQKGPSRAAVITAAASNQISLSDAGARHGLLTYYLLEGLHGGADADADGRITAGEAFAYARPAVERAARLQNQEQTPTSSNLDAPLRPWITLKK